MIPFHEMYLRYDDGCYLGTYSIHPNKFVNKLCEFKLKFKSSSMCMFGIENSWPLFIYLHIDTIYKPKLQIINNV